MLAYACAVAAASPLANRYIDLIENAVTGSLHDEAGRCIMGGEMCSNVAWTASSFMAKFLHSLLNMAG